MKRRRMGTNEGRPLQVSLHLINVLPQMRTVFDPVYLHGLALSIDEEGILQNPGIAISDNEEECRRYLGVFNKVKGTAIKPGDLTADANGVYHILIFGECRLRSLSLMWDNGQPTEDGWAGQENPGDYFRHRFRGEVLDVNSYNGIDAFKALGKQIRENAYYKPTLPERAVAMAELYEFRRLEASMAGKRFTLKQFAEAQKMSESSLRELINWVKYLPIDVQENVRLGAISPGISNQLLRAWLWAEKNVEDDAERKQIFDGLIVDAVGKNDGGVGQFTKMVSSVIRTYEQDQQAIADGQYTLENLMDASAERVNKRLARKRELLKAQESALQTAVSTVRLIGSFLESARLSPDHSPTLSRSVRRQIVNLADLLEALQSQGSWLSSPETWQRIAESSAELKKLDGILSQLYPEGVGDTILSE